VGKAFEPPDFRGQVVGLTDKTVTIKPQGSLKFTATTFNRDGTIKDEKVYVQDNGQPPRMFDIDAMRPRPGRGKRIQYGHMPDDLRMGDVVLIGCKHVRGTDYCTRIQIYRRPGGKVPPAYEDKDARFEKRWDTIMNAKQAAEEKAFVAAVWLSLRLIR
jgi:hypothetical protein